MSLMLTNLTTPLDISFHKNRFPFNSTSPIGYSVAIILLCLMTGYVNYGCANLFAIPMAAFIFAVSVIKDIKNILNSINEIAENSNVNAQENYLQAAKQFNIFIETHSTLKQLSYFNFFF